MVLNGPLYLDAHTHKNADGSGGDGGNGNCVEPKSRLVSTL